MMEGIPPAPSASDFAKTRAGAARQQTQSLQIFDSFTATRFSTPGKQQEGAMSEVASIRLLAGTIGSWKAPAPVLDR